MINFTNQRKGEMQLLETELKQEWTKIEICAACGFTVEWFRQLRNAGKIPPPDDTSRKPFIWYHRTILDFIEEWLETHPQPIDLKNQSTKP